MKRIIIFAALLALLNASVAIAQGARDNTSDWELVWSDEFDGNGPVSDDDWNYERGFVRNHEYQWYQPQNAYKLDGILVLE